MMRIAIASTKGAPGATTLAFALSRWWSRERAVLLVEADPAGGVLAARLGLSQEPGFGTLAAAGRHDVSSTLVGEHTQPGPCGVGLLVGPSSPHYARSALRASAAGLGPSLARLDDTIVVLDIGRLDAEEPSWPMAISADALVVLTAPTLEGADALAVRLASAEVNRSRIHLVTAGDGPYRGTEIAELCAVSFLAHMPHDPISSSRLWASPGRIRRRRRPMGRVTSQVAGRIATVCEASAIEAVTAVLSSVEPQR